MINRVIQGVGREPRRSVYADTDWGCELGGILDTILKRVSGLRAERGVVGRILIETMDVKSAVRQVGVGPYGTSRFAYRLGQFLFVDFCLQRR